jgi:hypothetical protein
MIIKLYQISLSVAHISQLLRYTVGHWIWRSGLLQSRNGNLGSIIFFFGNPSYNEENDDFFLLLRGIGEESYLQTCCKLLFRLFRLSCTLELFNNVVIINYINYITYNICYILYCIVYTTK